MFPRALARRLVPLAAWVLAAAALTATAAQAAPGYPSNAEKMRAAGSKITGTATYRERIALTPEAVFEATLEDVSRPDVPAPVMGRVRIPNPGSVPIRFTITYDPRKIVAGNAYAVRVTIRDRGRLAFANDTQYRVLTRGNPDSVAILLKGVPSPKDKARGPLLPELAPLPAMFEGLLPCADCMGTRYQLNLLKDGAYMQSMTYLRDGHDATYYEVGRWELSTDLRALVLEGGREGRTYWSIEDALTLRKLDREGREIVSDLSYELIRTEDVLPMEPRVQLRGMFRHRADAARFRDCLSGLEWPVAMSDDYRDLERAYSGLHMSPGAPLLVTLEGRVAVLPTIEGDLIEPTLVVERFLKAWPGEKCPEPRPQHELANTRWVPMEMNGKAVAVPEDQREAWIVFDPKKQFVTGSGGCNRIMGGYRVESGGRLTIEKMTSTMMACPNMDDEQAFLNALEATVRFRIVGRSLQLFDTDGRMVVRLEERNL